MSEATPRTRSCGCRSTPRRRCELCDPRRVVFTACSARCLERHLTQQHAGARQAETAARAVGRLAALNRDRQGYALYAAHRERLGKLLRAVQRAEGLCVLGAGNCDDLELPALVRDFGQVHLVDLDGTALELALARLPDRTRAHVVLHPGLDLSGTIDRIDRWGDREPSQQELAELAGDVSRAVSTAVGRTFDVVLSACVLSQLYLPVRNSLLMGLEPWKRLFAAIDRAHLATMAALTRPGGTAVLALDVTSSHKLPELSDFVDPHRWEELGAAATAAIGARKVALDPDPKRVLGWLAEPALAAAIERPRLTEPWVWDTGGGVLALVYAVLFTRAS